MRTFSDRLVPFFTLSYPIDTPSPIDSFPDSQYYNNGPLDACLIVTCIAVMAILRDFVRLAILEPFARWHLTRDLRRKHQLRSPTIANGNGNGKTADNGTIHRHNHPPSNGEARPISKREAHVLHRSVLRFAEQGWPAIYYSVQWTFGFVCHLFPLLLSSPALRQTRFAVYSP
jgi:acyl-CoA-dependent ceramide synthase